MTEFTEKMSRFSNKAVINGFRLVGLYSVFLLLTEKNTWYGSGLVMVVALNCFTLAKVYSIGEKVDS